MMTVATTQNPTLLRRAMTYLYTFVQYLDYSAAEETAATMHHAIGRISALEREVADLKAQQPGRRGVQENAESTVGELPLFEGRLPA